MADRYNQDWSREETILAFDLYCRSALKDIDDDNPDVIELANLLGRTPAALAMKMWNLASHDPRIIERGRTALPNASKLDAEIFEEFTDDWNELSCQARQIEAGLRECQITDICDLDDIDLPPGKMREQRIKTRVGQTFFRESVLKSYDSKCCITGIDKPELLIASHIKPWSASDEKTERTNPSNGLCLNALHDRAFDQGLITITKDYKVRVSTEMKKADMDESTKYWFIQYDEADIALPDRFLPDQEFIEYHNDVVFQG